MPLWAQLAPLFIASLAAVDNVLLTRALRRVPAVSAAVANSLVVVYTSLLSLAFLGERVGAEDLLGGGGVLAGVGMVVAAREWEGPEPDDDDREGEGVTAGLLGEAERGGSEGRLREPLLKPGAGRPEGRLSS